MAKTIKQSTMQTLEFVQKDEILYNYILLPYNPIEMAP